MAKKKLAAIVKIQIPAGQATPAPPVGTALGPHGINIMDFCKAYNAATENQRGMVIPAEISIYEDRSFTFVTKTPPTPFLLRQAAGIEKGAANARTDKAGSVSADQVRQIAETKMPDLNADRPRRCDRAGGRHRPFDGHRGHRLAPSPTPQHPHDTPAGGPRRRIRVQSEGADQHPTGAGRKRRKARHGQAGQEDRRRTASLRP